MTAVNETEVTEVETPKQDLTDLMEAIDALDIIDVLGVLMELPALLEDGVHIPGPLESETPWEAVKAVAKDHPSAVAMAALNVLFGVPLF